MTKTAAASLCAGLALWEAGVRALGVKPVLLPAPSAIARVLVSSRALLAHHAATTATIILLGFALGGAFAVAIALAFHLSPRARAALEPYVMLSQLVPKAALAPLFVIWMGFGLKPKIMIVALVSFFPTFANAFQGLSSHDPDLDLLMRGLRAGRLTTLLRLQLPFAVPYVVAGLKTSALLAVTGCVIAEFVGADRGLGYLLLASEGALDTPMLFAALAALCALGLLAYAVPVLLERTILERYMPSAPRRGAP